MVSVAVTGSPDVRLNPFDSDTLRQRLDTLAAATAAHGCGNAAVARRDPPARAARSRGVREPSGVPRRPRWSRGGGPAREGGPARDPGGDEQT